MNDRVVRTPAGEVLPTVRAVAGERYRSLDVPVSGGDLRVGVWVPGPGAVEAPVVLAVHGITSSHLTWPLLAAALPEVTLVAPDLRGRGWSNGLPGPYGMPAHAEDLVAVLDALGVDQVVAVGHSMGGFASLVLADRHPDRVSSLVLVDGGMPLLPPPGITPEQLSQAVLGPAADRLRMTFPDRAAYRDFWREHPAFADWTPELTAYVDYDLQGEPPRMRPATQVAALDEDIRELVDGDSVLGAVQRLRHPVTWLVAPRGLQDEVPPLYPPAVRERWCAQVPGLQAVEVPDTNHYTIVTHRHGAEAVLRWVRRALPGR